jgi:Tfp pilus assembly protein FimT
MDDRQKAIATAVRGFTMLEMAVVLVIVMIVFAMALIQVNNMLPQIRANTAMDQVVGELRTARALAISQRRNIQVQFAGNNQINLTRFNVPNGTTSLGGITLQGNMQFKLLGMPDTPDRFGNQFPVEFGGISDGPPTMMYLSDGTFVDNNGNPINGSIYLGLAGSTAIATARAITVLGATGRVRSYHGQGNAWVE